MLAIETRGLTKRYGRATPALRDLDLQVESGETFGLLGPNGAGKSTTLQCLVDLIRPTAGSVSIFGRAADEPAARMRIGYLPQSVALPAYHRGLGLLDFHARLLGLPAGVREQRIAELVGLLGLAEAATRRVSEYSKGMLQRLGLAQALLHDPDLLILDEPASSLDPLGRRRLSDLVSDGKRRGKTILISSHILSDLERICDRVAILRDGTLVRAGTLTELSLTAGMRLYVGALPPGAIESLVAAGAKVTVEPGSTVVRCPDECTRAAVDALLARLGVSVDRIEAETSSLEEVYLASVGGADAG